MSSPRQNLIAALRPGVVVEVTNHYITREDHPCYGTTTRTVTKANGSSWYHEGAPWPIPWPKAADVYQYEDELTFEVYGHPTPEARYMTIRVLPSAVVDGAA